MAVKPDLVARTSAGDGSPPPTAVVRVLGVRMAVQALLVARARRPGDHLRSALLIGAAVDVAHAASMVAAAVWKPAYRTSALASAGVATLSAGAGVVAAGHASTDGSARAPVVVGGANARKVAA